MVFSSRTEAGQKLLVKLQSFRSEENLLLLAISSGGIIVGKELSRFLGCSLDLLICEKIISPRYPELALGWVGSIGREILDRRLMEKLELKKLGMKDQLVLAKNKVEEKEKAWRSSKPMLNLLGKTVLLVDDGIATGMTMSGAIQLVRQQEPKKIVVTVPVVAREALPKIEKLADEVIYLYCPELFISLSEFYEDFPQIQLEEVVGFIK